MGRTCLKQLTSKEPTINISVPLSKFRSVTCFTLIIIGRLYQHVTCDLQIIIILKIPFKIFFGDTLWVLPKILFKTPTKIVLNAFTDDSSKDRRSYFVHKFHLPFKKHCPHHGLQVNRLNLPYQPGFISCFSATDYFT